MIDTWPGVVFLLGTLALVAFLVAVVLATMREFRKTKVSAAQRRWLAAAGAPV